MKRSKKYIAAAAKIEADRLYTPLEAVTLVRETSTTKYDSTIDVALCLGVDPKKADQAIRSTVNLPHGTGKTSRVLVFANGERADEARAAGADIVGGDELIDEVSKGRLDFDAVVATPDLVGRGQGHCGKGCCCCCCCCRGGNSRSTWGRRQTWPRPPFRPWARRRRHPWRWRQRQRHRRRRR